MADRVDTDCSMSAARSIVWVSWVACAACAHESVAPPIDAAVEDAPVGDGPAPDAPAPDAPAVDAAPADAANDAVAIDAPPIDWCALLAPTSVTAPTTALAFQMVNPPAAPSRRVALAAVTTSVPLAALSFDVSHGGDVGTVRWLAGCAGATLADGTLHSDTYPGWGGLSTYWTDGAAAALAAGTYVLIAEQPPIGTGPAATALIHGAIPAGAACTDPLVTAGVLGCETGSTCIAGTCVQRSCANGLDDDGDGHVDGADPGCAAPEDDSEADGCASGGACPACADGLDDDGDGATDWPADPGCQRRGDADEANCSDPNGVIDVTGAGYHPFGPGIPVPRRCRRLTFDGPEHVFRIRYTTAGNTLIFGGELGTRVALFRATCDSEAVTCVTITPQGPEGVYNLPPGEYYAAVWATTGVAIYP